MKDFWRLILMTALLMPFCWKPLSAGAAQPSVYDFKATTIGGREMEKW